jgi:hypothetical protein
MKTEFRQLSEAKIERKSFGLITKITPSALLIGVLALQACGSKSNDKTNNPTQIDASVLVQDSQLTSGIVNASHGDVVAAAADQGTSSSMLGLSLSDSDDDDSTVTKTCAASSDGKSAIVSISSNVNRTRTKSSGGGRVVITSTRTGSSATTRTWSRADGTAVACNNSGTGANVDFKNPDGLKLDISFERSRNDSMTCQLDLSAFVQPFFFLFKWTLALGVICQCDSATLRSDRQRKTHWVSNCHSG